MSGDQIVVVDTVNLDYETASGYTLTVSGSDGTFSDNGTYTIDITNVNDNTPFSLADLYTGSEDMVLVIDVSS
jgi:hypothetical protein